MCGAVQVVTAGRGEEREAGRRREGVRPCRGLAAPAGWAGHALRRDGAPRAAAVQPAHSPAHCSASDGSIPRTCGRSPRLCRRQAGGEGRRARQWLRSSRASTSSRAARSAAQSSARPHQKKGVWGAARSSYVTRLAVRVPHTCNEGGERTWMRAHAALEQQVRRTYLKEWAFMGLPPVLAAPASAGGRRCARCAGRALLQGCGALSRLLHPRKAVYLFPRNRLFRVRSPKP